MLFRSAPVWQQEDVACRGHIEDRPVVEEYIQPPILFDGRLDPIHAQPAGQLSQILIFHQNTSQSIHKIEKPGSCIQDPGQKHVADSSFNMRV